MTIFDYTWPAFLLAMGALHLIERRRDRRIIAAQDKLIAEQKLLLSNADEVIAGLNGRLQYAARDHQVTIQSYERLLDRREAKDSDSARSDIDAVVAERRAAKTGDSLGRPPLPTTGSGVKPPPPQEISVTSGGVVIGTMSIAAVAAAMGDDRPAASEPSWSSDNSGGGGIDGGD